MTNSRFTNTEIKHLASFSWKHDLANFVLKLLTFCLSFNLYSSWQIWLFSHALSLCRLKIVSLLINLIFTIKTNIQISPSIFYILKKIGKPSMLSRTLLCIMIIMGCCAQQRLFLKEGQCCIDQTKFRKY